MSLTKREDEVLRVKAEGRSTKEIAEQLGISTQTVRNHLTAGYHKLGVTDIVGAMWAKGWVRIA
jgi:DNA-binding CsgD family transcriptional regulator